MTSIAFQTNVCVYKLVKPDAEAAEDGKSTAELVRRSLCKYPETMYLNLHETHFSFIQDVRMYCHSYRCRKCGESLWNKASMLRRHERTCTGVCVVSILVACTIRRHRCSNVWTTRTFAWLNRCATIRIELPLISSVGSIRNNFRRTVTRSTGCVGPSSDTMPTPCTCGQSCKTCLWDGKRDDGKRTTSDPILRSCTDRWLRNG